MKKAINGKASSNVREKVELMIEDLNSKKKKKDVDVPVQVGGLGSNGWAL